LSNEQLAYFDMITINFVQFLTLYIFLELSDDILF